MDDFTVIGFRNVSFKDERTQANVNGYSLYLTQPADPEDIKVVGTVCQKIFISSDRISYVPHVGDQIRLYYNRYGKPNEIALI